jgi:hypothetical protein
MQRRTAGLVLCAIALPTGAVADPMHEGTGEAHQTMEMSPLGIEESRDASGTSWQPESTPMFMWHAKAAGWMLGLHTSSFAGYDDNAGTRGDRSS